ncbi:MAG: ATP-binding protein, partial [Planctomycetota bacterium]|nr:ATP-binding protein [Planctomycetota bacterium]
MLAFGWPYCLEQQIAREESGMDTMIIQGVRCFRSRQEVPLAPLTLLVGENSTGKSTFLAAVRLAWDVLYTESEPDFNEEPFNLGAFDNIATYSPGKGGGRAKSFILGGKFTNGSPEPRMQSSASFKATFEEEEGQPALRRLMVESGEYSITASKVAGAKGIKFSCKAGGMQYNFSYPYFRPASLSFFLRAGGYLLHDPRNTRTPPLPSSKKDREALEHLATGVLRQPGPRPYATAPIRTKPERTYNPKRVRLKAEGGHIPLV